VECFNTFGETEGLLRALRRKHRDHSRRGRRVGWATKQNSGMDRGGTEIKNFCESASKSLAIFEIEFFRACEPRHRPDPKDHSQWMALPERRSRRRPGTTNFAFSGAFEAR
jgi:hypothetical protein